MKDLEYFKKNFKIRKYKKNFKIKNRILFIYNLNNNLSNNNLSNNNLNNNLLNNKKYLFSNFNTFFKIDDKFSKISWNDLYDIDKILEVLENEDNNRRAR